MSRQNPRSQKSIYMKEKQVLESEASSEEHFVKRSQSGRRIEEVTLRLRKCQSTQGQPRKSGNRIHRLETQHLKVPQVPDRVVNLVNILQHENFLTVIDKYFKPTMRNKLRKQSQPKRFNVNKNSMCTSTVTAQTDLDCNNL